MLYFAPLSNFDSMSRVGFRSLTYRFPLLYNFLNLRLYDWKRKFATIAALVGKPTDGQETLKVVDLACGTGYLLKFLPSYIDYEGWDLNEKFIRLIEKDWRKGCFKVRNVTLKLQNIMDLAKHDGDKRDVIVLSDILHHVYPRNVEVVELAKRHARRLIIAEPSAIRPKDIHAYDWIARSCMGIVKRAPERVFKWMDFFVADNDGINPYEKRYEWNFSRTRLVEFFRGLGAQKVYTCLDEVFGVWES